LFSDAVNARYYDPTIARFISPDTIVPGVADPGTQSGPLEQSSFQVFGCG
jgi:hypothetical protein